MKIKLIRSRELKDFPSGSALEFFDGRLYVVGDDARQVLVLNKRWKEIERIKLFDYPEVRIPKEKKADLEASYLDRAKDHPTLVLLGSGSLEPRNKCILVQPSTGVVEEKDLHVFYDRIRREGIRELNIEAATSIKEYLIFCNRGNLTNRDNHFIITSGDFWKNQETAELSVFKFEMPVAGPTVVGISGITYSKKNDWLVFTASTEVTASAYEDGEIGESYIGIIENASRKIGRKKMTVSDFAPLSGIDPSLAGKKIESVCIQSDRASRLKVHLVADNDTGVTYLFKLRLKQT
ncbi:MAG TPA: hypothetical protein VM012_09900 [Flavitalea sp.]|nr:hypothetical protein [Flavitalea sp.]